MTHACMDVDGMRNVATTAVSLPGLTRQSMSGCSDGSRMSVRCCVTVWAPGSSPGVTTTFIDGMQAILAFMRGRGIRKTRR